MNEWAKRFVTSYGRNKNPVDVIKNIVGRIPEAESYPLKELAFQIDNISLQNASIESQKSKNKRKFARKINTKN